MNPLIPLLILLSLPQTSHGKDLPEWERPTKSVRILHTQGPSYVFWGKNIQKAKEGLPLKKGHIVATPNNSGLSLNFSGNGVLILAPSTQVSIGDITKNSRRHIVLIEGEILFQTKGGIMKKRPPSVIVSVRDFSHGYIGEKYKIKFRQQEQSLTVVDKKVHIIPLEKRSF